MNTEQTKMGEHIYRVNEKLTIRSSVLLMAKCRIMLLNAHYYLRTYVWYIQDRVRGAKTYYVRQTHELYRLPFHNNNYYC